VRGCDHILDVDAGLVPAPQWHPVTIGVSIPMRHHVKPGRGAASATARDSSASPLLRRFPVEEPAHGDGAAVAGPLVGPGAGLGHSFDRIPIHPEGAPPIQRAGRAGPFSRAPAARSANGTGLAAPLKAGIQHLSGVSLDDVTVHYNSPLPARMQALAYTQGTQIHVGAGQERHLAHEAWHVVQQKQGRVAAKMRLRGQGVNDDASLEREADVMGERALRSPVDPARVEGGTGPVATAPQAHGSAASAAPIQAKWILRAGQRVEVPDNYVLQHGESLAPREPPQYGLQSTPEFRERRDRMRQALQVPEDERGHEKIGFPFGFFGNAFQDPANPSRQSVSLSLRGGVEHKGQVEMPNSHTPLERIVPMLPTPMTKGGHLARILGSTDLSQVGSAVPPGHVTMDRVREAMSGLQFAANNGIDPSTVHQPSAQIDFQGTQRGTGRTLQFDHFSSPQPKELTARNRYALQLEQSGVDRGLLEKTGHYPNPNPKAQTGIDRGWAKGAYTDHTNDSKGSGVIGLWDQTSDSEDRIRALQGALTTTEVSKGHPVVPGRVAPVDLQLDQEYVLEDHYARIQIENAQRMREAKEEKAKQGREQKRGQSGSDAPTGKEALPWGGPGPGAVNPYGWGQNHPLYMRYHRDDGAF
jgi:hypothetical protein